MHYKIKFMDFVLKILLFTFCLLVSRGDIFAQKQNQDRIDSLVSELPKQKEDTNKVKLLNDVSLAYKDMDPDKGIDFGRQALQLALKIDWKKGIGSAYNRIGLNNRKKNYNDTALAYFEKSLKTFEDIGDKQDESYVLWGIGSFYTEGGGHNYSKAVEYLVKSLNLTEANGDKKTIPSKAFTIGNVYYIQNDYPKALEYYFKTQKISEEIGDKGGLSNAYHGIGAIYESQENYEKALEYYRKGLSCYGESGNEQGIAWTLATIGGVYYEQKNYAKALVLYDSAIKICRDNKLEYNLLDIMGNKGLVYKDLNDLPKALKFEIDALDGWKKLNNKWGVAAETRDVGEIYLLLVTDSAQKSWSGKVYVDLGVPAEAIPKNKASCLKMALDFLERGLVLNLELKFPDRIKECYEYLAKAYKLSGDYKKAFECYQRFITIKDSSLIKENGKKLLQLGFEDEYQRKRLADSLVTINTQKEATLKLQKQKSYTIIGLAGIILMIAFSLSVFRSNKLIKAEKQKADSLLAEVQIKNHEITSKNKEITDNINYAQRIQSAILPDIRLIYKTLEQSFILYLPKDIVSGDFYGFAERDNKVIIIAADCTGHGVSGAFMSMIGSSLLNQVINEKGITEPAAILNHLNAAVIEALNQSNNESNDGMDVSICAFDLKHQKIEYAGANRPLWLARNGQMLSFSPDKYPIGGLQIARDRSFTNHIIDLQKSDTFYIFSDGYADQFGGEKGKKLMTSKFKEKLLAIQNEPMREQELILREYFLEWRGANEQVDDVLVIGVRV